MGKLVVDVCIRVPVPVVVVQYTYTQTQHRFFVHKSGKRKCWKFHQSRNTISATQNPTIHPPFRRLTSSAEFLSNWANACMCHYFVLWSAFDCATYTHWLLEAEKGARWRRWQWHEIRIHANGECLVVMPLKFLFVLLLFAGANANASTRAHTDTLSHTHPDEIIPHNYIVEMDGCGAVTYIWFSNENGKANISLSLTFSLALAR